MSDSNPKLMGKTIFELLTRMDEGALEILVASGISLQINGKSYDGEAFRAMVKSLKAPHDMVHAIRVQLNAQRKARDESVPVAKKFLKGAATALQNQFDSDPTILDKFGIPEPTEPKVRTTKEKAASAEQAQQTRAKRAGNKDAKAGKVKVTFESESPEDEPVDTPQTQAAG